MQHNANEKFCKIQHQFLFHITNLMIINDVIRVCLNNVYINMTCWSKKLSKKSCHWKIYHMLLIISFHFNMFSVWQSKFWTFTLYHPSNHCWKIKRPSNQSNKNMFLPTQLKTTWLKFILNCSLLGKICKMWLVKNQKPLMMKKIIIQLCKIQSNQFYHLT